MFPTVYVVDDDPSARDSLRVLIESLGYRCVACGDAGAFESAFRNDDAACILIDVRMPRVSGIELLRDLRSKGEHVPVIMISAHADVATATTAMRELATDFLEKPLHEQELLDQINAAVRSRERSRHADVERRERRERLSELSPRERQVLDGLVAGETSPQIADRLGLSRRTVEMHRGRLMRKMNAANLAELIRTAVLVELDQSAPPN